MDCGVLGTTQSECEAKGCLWCPVSSGSDPWCFYKSGTSGGGGDGENSGCTVAVRLVQILAFRKKNSGINGDKIVNHMCLESWNGEEIHTIKLT